MSPAVWFAVAVVADPVGAPTLAAAAAAGGARDFSSLLFESASSSRRFCSAPGLGRAASSMTTVNASASASPSTRYANGVAQLPPSPPRAPGARDRSRYMAHSHAKEALVRSRCAASRNGALVAFKSTCLTMRCLLPNNRGVLRGTSTPRWSFVVITLSCVVTGITRELACATTRSACTMSVSKRMPARRTASDASCSRARFLVSEASCAAADVGAGTTVSIGLSREMGGSSGGGGGTEREPSAVALMGAMAVVLKCGRRPSLPTGTRCRAVGVRGSEGGPALRVGDAGTPGRRTLAADVVGVNGGLGGGL